MSSVSYQGEPLSDELEAVINVGPGAFNQADLHCTLRGSLAVALFLNTQKTSILVQLTQLD